jgi:TonB family protein
MVVGIVAAIGLIWGGIHAFKSNPAPIAPPAAEIATASSAATPASEQASSVVPTPPATASTQHPTSAARSNKAKSRVAETQTTTSAGVQEVLPDVPDRSRRTIRGHVRVSVRVIVENDGSVFAALSEQRGPSRYFERLAIEAAKKWTFPPADASAQRLMLVKFDFSREGTTAQAVPLK